MEAQAAPEPEYRTAREILADWIEEIIEHGDGNVVVAEIQRRAVEEFSPNGKYRELVYRQVVSEWAREITMLMIHQSRRGADVRQVASMESRGERLMRRILVHAEEGRYVSLGSSVRPELDRGEAELLRQELGFKKRRALLGAVKDRAPDDVTPVREFLTPDELTAIWSGIYERGEKDDNPDA